MKVLVLGGHGFIGSHIVEALEEQQHEIVVFARRAPSFDTQSRWIEGDFLDSAKLTEALISCDIVIHSISSTVPSTSSVNPEYDIQTNLLGTVRLLELMRLQNIKRLIYLSSGGTVYGNIVSSPVSESHSLNPIASYGAVKVAIEKFIGVAENEWGLKATILRPSNPYGERQGHAGVQGVIATVLKNSISCNETQIYGDGSAIRDYIYVKDLARLVVKAVDSESAGIFNAGYGQGASINKIINIIEEIIGKEISKVFRETRSFDVKEIVLDNTKAKDTFSWLPVVDLDEGIRRHFEWMKNF